MFVEECDFCQEFAGLQFWLSPVLREESLLGRTFMRRGGVISLVGLGPLTSGYVLVLPEKHYSSIGELPDELLLEVTVQKELVMSALVEEFGSALCFEHGAVSDKKGGSCIDHAHIHVIPGKEKFRSYISSDFEETCIRDLVDLKAFCANRYPYLFIEDIDGKMYVYKIPDNIASQYLRSIWARTVGRPDEWDWGVVHNYSLMRETLFMMNRRFQLKTS